MQNTPSPNLHDNLPAKVEALPAPPALIQSPPANAEISEPDHSTHQLELARKLLPPSVQKRKVRAHSFASELTEDQLVTLCAWLEAEPIESVRNRVAAPPPHGFGKKVHATTLVRLKKLHQNFGLKSWVSDAMDTACDVLETDDVTSVVPLREALSLLLHARAMTFVQKQASPEGLDRLLGCITKLEKLKILAAHRPAAPRASSVPIPLTTRHHVELSIQPAPFPQTGGPTVTLRSARPALHDETPSPANPPA